MKPAEAHLEGEPIGKQEKIAAEYLASISKQKQRYPNLLKQINETECFVHLWKDADGVCPNDGKNGPSCALRAACSEGYENVHKKPVLPPPAPVKVAEEKPKEKSAKKTKPAKGKKVVEKPPERISSRGKWRGTGKYQRNGYTPMGRPVDQALEHLVSALGNPQCLPAGWSPNNYQEKYGHLGRLVLSQTSSYTSVIVDGQTVMRFWTNAGTCALIDIIKEMVKVTSTIEGVQNVVSVPEGSMKKLRPCTHRFELTFGSNTHERTLTTIGSMIRLAYLK